MTETKPNIVFIGVPTYDGNVHHGGLMSILHTKFKTPFMIDVGKASLLAFAFNNLFCQALNRRERGITHFLLMHADIEPFGPFLDTLMDVMTRFEADVVSAIVPIKDTSGFTSTALDEPDRIRRLTMKEIFERDKTFTAPNLLLNSGLMLVDIRKPWVEKAHFTIRDRVMNRDGKWRAEVMPEDWGFSRQATQLGAKLVATREVELLHHGSAPYPNSQAWGFKETDTEGCQGIP